METEHSSVSQHFECKPVIDERYKAQCITTQITDQQERPCSVDGAGKNTATKTVHTPVVIHVQKWLLDKLLTAQVAMCTAYSSSPMLI